MVGVDNEGLVVVRYLCGTRPRKARTDLMTDEEIIAAVEEGMVNHATSRDRDLTYLYKRALMESLEGLKSNLPRVREFLPDEATLPQIQSFIRTLTLIHLLAAAEAYIAVLEDK